MPKLSSHKLQERRDHILDVAFDLFTTKGYSATGMRDIMAAANLSKGGIYVHFESKADILLAIVKRFDTHRHSIASTLDHALSADMQLTHYIKGRLQAFQSVDNQKYARLVSEFWSLPSVIPQLSVIMDERYQAYQDDIRHILEQGVKDGVFTLHSSMDDMVYTIMSFIDGAAGLSSIGYIITDQQIHTIIHMTLTYLKGDAYDHH